MVIYFLGTCDHAIVVDFFAKTITGKEWEGCKCSLTHEKVAECIGDCNAGTALPGQFVPTK